MRWDETTGSVGVFRQPSGNANGNTIDRYGRLISCEQGNRRVTRTENDGSVTVLADTYDGKRLNSPNDVAVRGDGSIWFTDPNYGIFSDCEGDQADSDTLSGGKIFAECAFGRFDGIRLDNAGRIWAAAWDGVHCFDPDGTLIGNLLLPESVANLTFGGPKNNDLFICAGASVYTLRVTVTGARYPTSSKAAA